LALRFFVQLECNNHNRRESQVTLRDTFPSDEYWTLARSGDFLITGGWPEELRDEFLSYCRVSDNYDFRPIIVFDGTGALEEPLIKLSAEGMNKTLRVYSPDYPGYDLFFGMGYDKTFRFMESATAGRPRGSEINPAYIHSFLSVLESTSGIRQKTIRMLAEKKDDDIFYIARNSGIGESWLDPLKNPGSSGQNFRAFIEEMDFAFRKIHNRNTADNNNISRDIRSNNIIYINAQSRDPGLFNRYFSVVLDSLTENNSMFNVVFYEVNTRYNDGLIDHINRGIQRSDETIGICCGTVEPLLDRIHLAQFPRQVIYTRNGTYASQLLESYGEYEHWLPVRRYGNGLIPPLIGGWEVGKDKRPVVRQTNLTEPYRIQKIVKGYRGQGISLVRNL